VAVVVVGGGLGAMGSDQEVGESDATRSNEEYGPTDAGDAGAALDPL